MAKNVTVSKDNPLLWVMGLILVVLVAGALGVVKFPQSTGTSSTNLAPSGVSCPTTTGTTGYPRIALLAGYLNQQNNYQNTTAVIAYNVTSTPSPGYSYQTGVTSATAYINTSSIGLKCGSSYVIIFAGGSDTVTGYYPQQVTVGPVSGVNTTLSQFVPLQKMANLKSAVFSNTTSFGVNYTSGASNTANGVSASGLVTAGSSVSTESFTLRAGPGAYGGSGIQALFAANTVGVSGISLIGPGGQSMPSAPAVYPSTFNVPSGFTVYAFTLPAITVWSSTATYTPVFKTSSSMASNQYINFALNDLPGFVQNGQLSFPQGGVDPNTHADIAEPLAMYGGTSEQYNSLLIKVPTPPFHLCFSAGC